MIVIFLLFKMKQKSDHRKTKVSTRDSRMFLDVKRKVKEEDHLNKVKEMEEEFKNITGEGKKYSKKNDSENNSENIISNKNMIAIKFIQEKNKIINSVKDKIRKMQKIPKDKNIKNFDMLNQYGFNRFILGKKWKKLNSIKSKIYQYKGFNYFPNSISEYHYSNNEHINRFVECYTCGKIMNTINDDIILFERGESLHKICFDNLNK